MLREDDTTLTFASCVCVYIILCHCVYVYTLVFHSRSKHWFVQYITLVICVKCDRVAVREREREREEVTAKYLQKIASQKVL